MLVTYLLYPYYCFIIISAFINIFSLILFFKLLSMFLILITVSEIMMMTKLNNNCRIIYFLRLFS